LRSRIDVSQKPPVRTTLLFGTEPHAATVVGDTVGDWRETSTPNVCQPASPVSTTKPRLRRFESTGNKIAAAFPCPISYFNISAFCFLPSPNTFHKMLASV
jgi:hypothetical protein